MMVKAGLPRIYAVNSKEKKSNDLYSECVCAYTYLVGTILYHRLYCTREYVFVEGL